MERVRFASRAAAGRELALALQAWQHRRQDSTVIGLPRGGVSVAAEVAGALDLPLRSWAVRKLAHPRAPEYAIGAVAPGGVVLLDQPALARLGVSEAMLGRLVRDQQRELERRQRLYGDPAPAELAGRQLLVIDDGIATGYTARAALTSLRRLGPSRLVLAVPVCEASLVEGLAELVDDLVVLRRVHDLEAVGSWFDAFGQVSDGEVLALLATHR
jgi:predicted phosphoribosyltransferase